MSQHSCKSVLLWLEQLPSPENTPATPRGRKRKRSPRVERLPATMNSLPTRTPSPSKKRKKEQLDLNDNGTEDTPRPLRSVQSTCDDVSQQSSSSARSSAASSKSRSPTKQMNSMLFAPKPILFKQFDSDELPAKLDTIFETINQYSIGVAVVSEAYKTEIAKMTDKAFRRINDLAFTQLGKLPGPSPSPEQCAKAVRRAKRCEDRKSSEPSWNCMVHAFVLDLAIDHAEFRDKVFFENCTTARISPSTLVPLGHAGTALSSKMVDFAIHIEPSDRFQKAVYERAQLCARPISVNHTFYRPLIFCPIGVSIETKHTGQNWDDAMVQVGIWTAAQFARLEELIKETDQISGRDRIPQDEPETRLPFLPIIIIQGHDWNFLTAIKSSSGQTSIYHKVAFGSTASPLGVYQVVTTVQLLVRWVRDSFTGWFEKSCLNMTKDTVPNLVDTNASAGS